MEKVFGRSGALKAQGSGGLRGGNHGRGHRACGNRCAFEQTAAAWGFFFSQGFVSWGLVISKHTNNYLLLLFVAFPPLKKGFSLKDGLNNAFQTGVAARGFSNAEISRQLPEILAFSDTSAGSSRCLGLLPRFRTHSRLCPHQFAARHP